MRFDLVSLDEEPSILFLVSIYLCVCMWKGFVVEEGQNCQGGGRGGEVACIDNYQYLCLQFSGISMTLVFGSKVMSKKYIVCF